jgi:putative FmdB family regulatory protein
MPTYNYRCKNSDCEHEFEIVQKITENKLSQCPKCLHSTLGIVIKPTSFVLKGGGWFKTSGEY